MPNPHEIFVFTIEEVLLDIYEGNIQAVDTDEATKAFTEWLKDHDAHYFVSPPSPDAILRAILDTIKMGRKIVVVSTISPTQLGD